MIGSASRIQAWRPWSVRQGSAVSPIGHSIRSVLRPLGRRPVDGVQRPAVPGRKVKTTAATMHPKAARWFHCGLVPK